MAWDLGEAEGRLKTHKPLLISTLLREKRGGGGEERKKGLRERPAYRERKCHIKGGED